MGTDAIKEFIEGSDQAKEHVKEMERIACLLNEERVDRFGLLSEYHEHIISLQMLYNFSRFADIKYVKTYA